MNYSVVEKFVSINGEGRLSGQLAVFIRFAGCNLSCSYCDTKYANEGNAQFEIMTEEEIYQYIKSSKVKNVTLTGGEPLFQDGVLELLEILTKDGGISIEIETNGAVSLEKFSKLNNISFTMDYKLPSSNMESRMRVDNFNCLKPDDVVKFVVGDFNDLEKARDVINEFRLVGRVNIYISPVYKTINLDKIVDFMKENSMNGVTLQLQLHKIIWGQDKRGV